MKRERLLSALRRWCRRNGHSLRIDTVAAQGISHKIYLDGRASIVKEGELSPIYVQLILKQLGIPKDAV